MINQTTKNLIPIEIKDSIKNIKPSDEINFWWPWLFGLTKKSIWVHLGANWKTGSGSGFPDNPPPGFDIYIIQGDSNLSGWAYELSKLDYIPLIINLTGPEVYKNKFQNKIINLPYCYYHQQISRLDRINIGHKTVKYKIGSLTNRLTQSKCIIHAALLYHLPESDIVYSLHSENYKMKDVHYWTSSSNEICNFYMDQFQTNHLGKSKTIDSINYNQFNIDLPVYTQSVFNLTQESFHYSSMMDDQIKWEGILPGPFLTEKTWKALLTGTAIIPVGQYRTLAWLKTQGFQFDYGDLNLDFDDDPYNLTRLEKIIQLIKTINGIKIDDLDKITHNSRLHNQEHIWSDNFYNSCQDINNFTIVKLLNFI
jgi:hypothetical protein